MRDCEVGKTLVLGLNRRRLKVGECHDSKRSDLGALLMSGDDS